VLSPEIEDRDEVEVELGEAQTDLHLTRSSHLWTLLLLGLEVGTSTPLQKKVTLSVSLKIHKDAIFDRLKIKSIILVFDLSGPKKRTRQTSKICRANSPKSSSI
jgi:hypothetical protein